MSIWTGCQILKKFLVDVQAGIYGLMYAYPAPSTNQSKTSVSVSSRFSRNHPALISVCFFVSSEFGSRKHLAAIRAAKWKDELLRALPSSVIGKTLVRRRRVP